MVVMIRNVHKSERMDPVALPSPFMSVSTTIGEEPAPSAKWHPGATCNKPSFCALGCSGNALKSLFFPHPSSGALPNAFCGSGSLPDQHVSCPKRTLDRRCSRSTPKNLKAQQVSIPQAPEFWQIEKRP